MRFHAASIPARHARETIQEDVAPFLESRRHAEERLILRRDYETGVIEGRHPEHVTLCPLYPYQREGMLHLAFGERVLLADDAATHQKAATKALAQASAIENHVQESPLI